ncbi:universal stress protein [Streptomyces sp. NPDC058052]|uniref:universal stress protein n=1 Tax=Streptomyces sp. NPDC058052 TaxID=3346316 RepID=UPI0036E4E2FD
MTQDIVVGVDGTEEAHAAAHWAASEARLRGDGVLLVYAREVWPGPAALLKAQESEAAWARDMLARTADELRGRGPGIRVTTRVESSGAVAALVAAAGTADLVVLGSRALIGGAGHVVGSVGLAVAGNAGSPVVLVRGSVGEAGPVGPVTVGVDVREASGDAVVGFAFEEAARRRTGVNAVHVLRLPFYATLGPAMVPDVRPAVAPEFERSLKDLLAPWHAKYPDVKVTASVVLGSAGHELVRMTDGTGLVVVGRRTRRSALGAHLGSVAQAVLHHSRVPVAVVPHD